MPCCVKKCQSYRKPGSKVHTFRFPLHAKDRLDKWIAAVGKPNWKPSRASRICDWHFYDKDLIQGMGYRRSYIHKDAVPKDYPTFIKEREQIDNAKPKENCNATSFNKYASVCNVASSSKSVSSSQVCSNSTQSVQKATPHLDKQDKLYKTTVQSIQADSREIYNVASSSKSVGPNEVPRVLEKSAASNHNNFKISKNNNIEIMIKNVGPNTFNIQIADSNQSVRKAIPHLEKKDKLTQIDSKEICNVANSSKSVSSSLTRSDSNQLVQKAIPHLNKKDQIIQVDTRAICSVPSGSKSVSSKEACVLDKSTALDHSYSRDNSTMTNNVDLKDITQKVSQSSINYKMKNKKEDSIDATKKIKLLSISLKEAKVKNKTFQQKLRRLNEKVMLIIELFDRLQKDKLISGGCLHLLKTQLGRLALQTKDKNDQPKNTEAEKN
ncbi:PREDICTED: THAP domain-containing protein 5-like [Wasmannia auropunctata]|uniref:THAP domain-containing protein 5-like n=1 Tax=Wasmannia auropunctata TaxID=64793 RepID=UPI0005EE1633|nr:PREDICTED: THAP domain-containing protein 5-like [Wasmannia auropunctata]